MTDSPYEVLVYSYDSEVSNCAIITLTGPDPESCPGYTPSIAAMFAGILGRVGVEISAELFRAVDEHLDRVPRHAALYGIDAGNIADASTDFGPVQLVVYVPKWDRQKWAARLETLLAEVLGSDGVAPMAELESPAPAQALAAPGRALQDRYTSTLATSPAQADRVGTDAE